MATICLNNYIGGDLTMFSASQFTPVYNPSRGELIAQAPDSDAREVDRARRFNQLRQNPVSCFADGNGGRSGHTAFAGAAERSGG